MPHFPEEIEYSEKYNDEEYEYRHVLLPKEVYKNIPRGRLLYEEEWRSFRWDSVTKIEFTLGEK